MNVAAERVRLKQENEIMAFRLGDDPYGILAYQIIEIVNAPVLHFLPNLPFYMPGVTNYRGDVVPFVILSALFGYQGVEETREELRKIERSSFLARGATQQEEGAFVGQGIFKGRSVFILQTSLGRLAVSPDEIIGARIFRDRDLSTQLAVLDRKIKSFVLGGIPFEKTVLLILNETGLKSLVREYASISGKMLKRKPIPDNVQIEYDEKDDILREYLENQRKKEEEAKLPVDLSHYEVDELRAACAERGVADTEKMTKVELIETLHKLIYST